MAEFSKQKQIGNLIKAMTFEELTDLAVEIENMRAYDGEKGEVANKSTRKVNARMLLSAAENII